jgi:hypothetical protein
MPPPEVCPAALLPPVPATLGTLQSTGHAIWDPVKRRWLHNH